MSQFKDIKAWLSNEQEQKVFLEEIRLRLPAQCQERILSILKFLTWLLALLDTKNLSISRLLQLCFGTSTESARNLCGKEKPKGRKRAKGHGRNSNRTYTGARRVSVSHPSLKPGQQCPDCKKGKVRRQKKPAVAVAVTAQPPVGAVIYEMESLRCDTCGKVFTASPPPEAGGEKYDASVGVMAGLMRYGSGMPFHRLEKLQKSLGVPLPASVQWEQVLRVWESLKPVMEHLIEQAAQASVFYSDDTTMKVSALRKDIQNQDEDKTKDNKSKRTGIFTSGIVGEVENHSVSVFFTGRSHAGENLSKVLEHRQEGRPAPLHMCDGLSRNDPKGHETVSCQCNVHARRGFVELRAYFPQECYRVMESFSSIYRVEAQAKAEGLSAQERLKVHQAQSQPVMEELRTWFSELIDGKKVEPNSGLGGAIKYMQNRWSELTQFLRVPGAPMDNNVAERTLKMVILHRKNSLFYRTQRGADVGDLFMSLVQTCRSNEVNPFEYMMAVVRNEARAKADPGAWLPWNFQTALAEPSALAP